MAEHVARVGKKCMQDLVEKSDEKRVLARPGHR